MSIEHPRQVDVLRDNVIYSLTPPTNNRDFESVFTRRVSLFSQEQAHAILNFFLHYTEIYPMEEWAFTLETADDTRRGIEFWKNLLD
jgi:hypothetical protein